MHMWLRCAALLILVSLVGCKRPKEAAPENFSVVDSDDAEMKEAFRVARSRLGEFWTALDQPPEGAKNFSVKVPVTDGDQTEYFWLVELQHSADKVSGTVGNNPELVHNVKAGQRLEVGKDKVVDWMYMRGGKMHGNFTMRPLFKTMKPEDAQRFKAMLAEP